jgi:putative alpha-1,2-mannosidase
MVQLGPNNIFKGWDWCSGYHYSDSTITGFAHTHLSGTGIGDYGDLLFMPVQWKDRGGSECTIEQWSSTFSHGNEKVSPGYYSVHLDKYNIDVELTATQRVGVHKYTYPADEHPQLIIDLNSGTGWDKLREAKFQQLDDHTLSGYRFSTGWAKDQRLYFRTQFLNPLRE